MIQFQYDNYTYIKRKVDKNRVIEHKGGEYERELFEIWKIYAVII